MRSENDKHTSQYGSLDPAAERERHRDERRESRNRIKQARLERTARQERTEKLERGDA